MDDLIIKEKYDVSNPIDFPTMLSRIGNNLPSLSEKAIAKIQERMPEIHRATKAFGRTNSPVENKLMSLNMISHSPYKQLKQCLSQIEKKRNALKEAYFKAAKDENKLNQLQSKLQDENLDRFEKRNIEIEITELQSNMADSKIYIEGALKSIGDFQDAYEQIRKNNNIPENWDEKDFIEAEFENHIKSAFQHAMRDLQCGRAAISTLEYFEQYGIKPAIGYAEARKYIVENKDENIESLYAWYEEMYEKYKDCPAKAMKHIGLDEIYNEDFIYLEELK